MAKLITKAEWSSKKKSAGTDDLVRDQWHIGEHLEEYAKLDINAFDKRLEKLADIRRKFGDYRKALVEKDKKKVHVDFIADIDKIVRGVDKTIDEVQTAQSVAGGSTEAMMRECEAHLEIRKKALVIVTEVAKAMRELADDVETGAAIADKGLKQALKGRAEKIIMTNTEGVNLARRGFEAAQEALQKARALEKERITREDGKVMKSRSDGPIRQHEAKLDKNYVTTYKQESGKYFTEATKITVAINGIIQQMGNALSRAREALEEAEANTMGKMDTKRFIVALGEVREEAAKISNILGLANDKMAGDERRVADTLKAPGSATEKAGALRMIVEKQLTPRLELIAGRAEAVKSVARRAAVVPADTEDKQLTQLRTQVVEETRQLAELFKTTQANGERTKKRYTEAIESLEG